MPDLSAFLKSINKSKINLIRESAGISPNTYPAFIVRRLLSYSRDAILFANELNCTPNVDSQLQYEYFLHVLPKQNRFASLAKTEQDDNVSLLTTFYHCSKDKARTLVGLHTEKQLESIRARYRKGGLAAKDK